MRQTHILKKLGCFLLGFTLVASFSACGEKRPGGSSVGREENPRAPSALFAMKQVGTKWHDEMAKQFSFRARQ